MFAILKKIFFTNSFLFKILNALFLVSLKERDFFKRSEPIEKIKFRGFISLENSDKISELPTSNPK